MNGQKLPKERLPLNQSRLNQLSKSALLKVGEDPDPYFPYSVQLALWALNSGKFPSKGQGLELTLGQMFGWKPERVERFLERNAQGDPIDLLTSEESQDPERLALAILNELEHKLSLHSGYPTLSKM